MSLSQGFFDLRAGPMKNNLALSSLDTLALFPKKKNDNLEIQYGMIMSGFNSVKSSDFGTAAAGDEQSIC